MSELRCADVRERAADLALDLLTGEERAAALAHLEGCASCRADVASLTAIGEALLALAPDVPPSPGFDERVVARIAELREAAGPAAGADPGAPVRPARPARPARRRGPGRRRAGQRRRSASEGPDRGPSGAPGPRGPGEGRGLGRGASRRRVVAVAAVVASAAAAVVLALGIVGPGTDDVAVAATSMRTADGEVVGRATLRDDGGARLGLDLRDWMADLQRYGSGAAGYRLAVETEGGSGAERELYDLPAGEPGRWEIALDDDAGDVTGVALVDARGRTWCRGRF